VNKLVAFSLYRKSPLFQNYLKSAFGLFYEMKKETLIHFWDLSDSARFSLDGNFCKKLFDQACGGDLHSLAKELNISYPFVCQLRRLMYSIPKNILISLSNLSKTPLSEIEINIVFVRTRHGHKSNIKFPICSSDEMASLVGHVYGDGFISNKKRQFEYSNTNRNLIKEVELLVERVFGIKPITKKLQRITFPSIVGEILKCFGAPSAPKVLNYVEIPNWVLYGKKSFKKAFLRAIFDDDGSVMLSENFNAKGVNLHWTVHSSKTEVLSNIFNQIKKMLEEFNIYCGKPIVAREYFKGNGKHIVMYINITDYLSLVNFYKEIGFTNELKKIKLEKILLRGNRCNKQESIILKNSIIKLLENKKMSTADLAESLNVSIQKIRKKLIQLEREDSVERTGCVLPNRFIIWKLREVTNL